MPNPNTAMKFGILNFSLGQNLVILYDDFRKTQLAQNGLSSLFQIPFPIITTSLDQIINAIQGFIITVGKKLETIVMTSYSTTHNSAFQKK